MAAGAWFHTSIRKDLREASLRTDPKREKGMGKQMMRDTERHHKSYATNPPVDHAQLENLRIDLRRHVIHAGR